MTRLETLSPELVRKLQNTTTEKQRAATLAACEFAVTHATVDYPLVDKSLEKLRSSGVLNPKEIAELDALAAQLDEEYFTLQEAAEEGRVGAGDYMRVFGRARAVAALSFAGGEDPFHAATDAIYEASATTDDKIEFVVYVQSMLE